MGLNTVSSPAPNGGCKNALVGGGEGIALLEDPKVTHGASGLEISFSESVINNMPLLL